MSYETVLEQIKAAPEECLDEISVVIGTIVENYKNFWDENFGCNRSGICGIKHSFSELISRLL